MNGFIENLRQKPEYVRRSILYITAPVITVAVISLWFFSNSPVSSFGDNNLNTEKVGPMSILRDDIGGAFSTLKDGFSNLKDGLLNSGEGKVINSYINENKIPTAKTIYDQYSNTKVGNIWSNLRFQIDSIINK